MGFRFRKSVNMGLFRLNFSRSGVGTSFGWKGYRKTHSANGRKRTTYSVPGTGISYVSESRKKMPAQKKTEKKKNIGCLPWLLAVVLFFAVIGAATGSKSGNSEPADRPAPAIETTKATETTTATEAATIPTTVPATTEATEPETTEPTEQAVVEHTYILNKSSMKIHKPTCSSTDDIAEHNKAEFTGTIDTLLEQGYERCQRCYPT